jgi:hypothetical protein
MVDRDGTWRNHFDKALFSNSRREQGVPYHERSAKVLRFTLKKLRRKRWITLERGGEFRSLWCMTRVTTSVIRHLSFAVFAVFGIFPVSGNLPNVSCSIAV